jgi:hypothetical protein
MELVNNCLTKWKGLKTSNLEAHGISPAEADEEVAESCALCRRFSSVWNEQALPGCVSCPISKATGKACDRRDNSGKDAPWHRWTSCYDPKPMIEALKKARNWVGTFPLNKGA